MHLENGKLYHIYNRSNNNETIFKEHRNYDFFLKKYRHYMDSHLLTIAYCLMPTHFHFIVKVSTNSIDELKSSYGTFISSYVRAINKSVQRHGSLFQQHTKTKEIDDEKYLLTLISYVHQNPLRAKLVTKLQDWEYSSYPILAEIKQGDFPEKSFIRQYFPTSESFRKYSEEMVHEINRKYWI